MLQAARRWPDRLWAVEGCGGIGKHLAQRLVADGEPVVDVPAKLSARARVFSTGQGRKTDATDAHSVAVVALHAPNLRHVSTDDTGPRSGCWSTAVTNSGGPTHRHHQPCPKPRRNQGPKQHQPPRLTALTGPTPSWMTQKGATTERFRPAVTGWWWGQVPEAMYVVRM